MLEALSITAVRRVGIPRFRCTAHGGSEPGVLLEVLRQKSEFQGIPVSRDGDFDDHRRDLEAAWQGMLVHQLPSLPPVDAFWNALPEFFRWLATGEAPVQPAAYALGGGETVLRQRSLPAGIRLAAGSAPEVIRFAAANRLCVDLVYQGRTRRIEPYSLRRTQDGNILHASNREVNEHRSYRVDRNEGAHTTSEMFTPRYDIELTPSGPMAIPSTERSPIPRTSIGGFSSRPTRTAKPRSTSREFGSGGPTYVYQCPVCSKKFSRKTMSGALNPHKAPGG